MTREKALVEVKVFAAVVNSGAKTAPEEWGRVIELMKQFNIELAEI